MKKIAIIGTGNVATHLCRAFENVANVVSVNSRTLDTLPDDADFYIISVCDDAINEVASHLPLLDGTVCHTSGSVGMEILRPYAKKYGVFYPLLTFSKEKFLDYSVIPFFIEGNNKRVEDSLRDLAGLLSNHIYVADSERRMRIHVASVFACNYVNLLWNIASEILDEDSLPFDVLLPLIDETGKKIHVLPAKEAQTGPAVRKDLQILEAHRRFLADKPEISEIYRLLSEQIIKRH